MMRLSKEQLTNAATNAAKARKKSAEIREEFDWDDAIARLKNMLDEMDARLG